MDCLHDGRRLPMDEIQGENDMPTLLQEQIEYSINNIKLYEETNMSETLRKERTILALLFIADDTHHIRGMFDSLVLALSDMRGE